MLPASIWYIYSKKKNAYEYIIIFDTSCEHISHTKHSQCQVVDSTNYTWFLIYSPPANILDQEHIKT
jgi:hypothetical protein